MRGLLAAALLFAAPAGCSDGDDLVKLPGGDAVGPMAGAPGKDAVLFDNFQREPSGWDVLAGTWEPREMGLDARGYAAQGREFGLTLTGQSNWKDYTVQAQVVIHDDRQGHVGVVGHAHWDHHYFELVLGRDAQGVKSWSLRQRQYHAWTTLATGPLDYQYDTAYVVRLGFHGAELRAGLSRDGGRTFDNLGHASSPGDAWTAGRAGLVSYGGDASFDDVTVLGSELLFSQAQPWGAISPIRDKSNSGAAWPGTPPADGWYVTPIHAVVRPSDGKVFIFGFGRKGLQNCSGTTQREVGETWLLDPTQLDALNGGTLNITPINEQNQVIDRHVLYCAGHNTLADGRIFLSAGTDYTSPGGLPDSSPELGLKYSRIYNPATNSITRISALMTGGFGSGTGTYVGMKWYPTQLLMNDGKVLIFGGFHYSGGVSSDIPKDNRSFETFDPAITDANPNANPYNLLMDHEQGSSQTTPTRGYTNLFWLPRPVPAASAGTFARSVAVHGGFGKVFLFNHEPGPSGSARLHQKMNALNPLNGSSNEKGEGASGVMLGDGTLMFANGGHQGAGAARAYFYDPYLNPTSASQGWSSLDLGISRMYSDAVALPNGDVLIINGYNNANEPGNETDISNPLGDVRRPQIVNPYPPRSKTDLAAWPEPTHRGYHSFAVLLKDGRILVGGGKDQSHATGCEKNEIRIYEPPYLFAGPRPVITAPAEHATMTVGGGPVVINYTGNVRATRGVVLMAPGAITHGFDMGQRYVPLQVLAGPGDGQVTVLPPPNINVAQPGQYMLFVVSDAGAPSTTGVHINLVAPTGPQYNVGGDTYIEAECSSRRSGPWTLVSDASRSQSQFIEAVPGSGNHTAANAIDEGKVMWYDLNVTSGGAFNVWMLSQGPTTSDDSFWVSVDGNADTQLSPTATWGWVKLGTGTINIPTGKHQLKVKVREDGTRIDKIFLTKTSATPSGIANPPQVTCGGTPPMCTAPPAPGPVNVTPANCQATITWANVAGEDGYRIRRNGVVLPPTILANTTSFADSPLAAGMYSYEVQAFQGSCDSPWAAAAQVTVTCTTPTNPSITNLVVNDTATSNPPAGSDGIANSTQWSVQANFSGGGGQLSHGDRANTIQALSGMAATRLGGKPWIRTAADSKNYTPTSPPLATFTINNSTTVSLGVDSRHATAFLTGNGWASQGFSFTINEGTTARTYNVWSKTVTAGSTVTLPTIGATTAPCYLVFVE